MKHTAATYLLSLGERYGGRTDWLSTSVGVATLLLSHTSTAVMREERQRGGGGGGLFPPVGNLLSLMFNKPLDTGGNPIPSGEGGVCECAFLCLCLWPVRAFVVRVSRRAALFSGQCVNRMHCVDWALL